MMEKIINSNILTEEFFNKLVHEIYEECSLDTNIEEFIKNNLYIHLDEDGPRVVEVNDLKELIKKLGVEY